MMKRQIIRGVVTVGDLMNALIGLACLVVLLTGVYKSLTQHRDTEQKQVAAWHYGKITAAEDSARVTAATERLRRQNDSLLARNQMLQQTQEKMLRMQMLADSMLKTNLALAKIARRQTEAVRAESGNLNQLAWIANSALTDLQGAVANVGGKVDSLNKKMQGLSLRVDTLARRTDTISVQAKGTVAVLGAALASVRQRMAAGPATPANNRKPKQVKRRKPKLHKKPNPDG